MNAPHDDTGGRQLERHVQTVMVGIVTVLMLWVGKSVSESGQEIVRLQEQVATLSARLDSVSNMGERLNRLEVRVGILEDRGTQQKVN